MTSIINHRQQDRPKHKKYTLQHWHLLKINPTLEKTFLESPKNDNSQKPKPEGYNRYNKIELNEVKSENVKAAKGQCIPFLPNNQKPCCGKTFKTATLPRLP